MITVAVLRARGFSEREVKPFGKCIVVPGAEFDPDREAQLSEQGNRVFMTDVDGKPVSLVRVKPENVKPTPSISGAAETFTPRESSVASSDHTRAQVQPWSDQDDEQLIGLWSQKPKISVEQMMQKMGRSEMSVRGRIHALLKAKKIHSRWVHQREGKQSAPLSLQEDRDKPKAAPPKALLHETEKQGIRELKEDPVLSVLLEIRGLLQKQPEPKPLLFEIYCRKCRRGATVKDHEVWRVCPVCCEPLIILKVVTQE
jgi:hypothetical protein